MRIYDNIRKSIHFLLSTNLSEIPVMFTATAAGLGQPLNAIQLLWIKLKPSERARSRMTLLQGS